MAASFPDAVIFLQGRHPASLIEDLKSTLSGIDQAPPFP